MKVSEIRNFTFFALILWITGIIYMINKVHHRANESDTLVNNVRIRNNEEPVLVGSISSVVNRDFEIKRRKILNDLKDLSFFLNHELNNSIIETKKINYLRESLTHRLNSLLVNFQELSNIGNLGELRRMKSINLSNIIQNRFLELQNPTDCNNAKKLLCILNKNCGFGCQMHNLMHCFVGAYFSNRTMIINSDNWKYNKEGFEAYFEPISKTCKKSGKKAFNFFPANDKTKDVEILQMPPIDYFISKPIFLPQAVPKEYLNKIEEFHDNPFLWWSSQILNFLMKFNEKFKKTIQIKDKKLKYETPCVGVHVRRTDKIKTEAKYHKLDEYMKHVDEYYEYFDMKTSVKNRRIVYLATDDVTVIENAQKQYSNYKFIYDKDSARYASLNRRYSPESAEGVIHDIYFLSQCDYLVCTFSSQVCRLAYELMQNRFADASWRFRSLDDVFYFGGQRDHLVKAIYDHKPRKDIKEIELKVGDTIKYNGNLWNGFSVGKNLRTNQQGLFPSYKVIEYVETF